MLMISLSNIFIGQKIAIPLSFISIYIFVFPSNDVLTYKIVLYVTDDVTSSLSIHSTMVDNINNHNYTTHYLGKR